MAFSAAQADHRQNWLLAALDPEDLAHLEPHLETVILAKGAILYEPHDPIRSTYFPHDAIVCLINIMEEGQFVEVASFGRYKVQIPGTASQIAIERMQQAMQVRPPAG